MKLERVNICKTFSATLLITCPIVADAEEWERGLRAQLISEKSAMGYYVVRSTGCRCIFIYS